MSLLTIVQGACQVVGIPSPSSVIGNADTNVAQMLALVNLEGTELSRAKSWAELSVLSTWATVATSDQGPVTTVIGADYDRFVPGTQWDRSLIRPLGGPRSPQGWSQDLAFPAAGPYYNLRIYGSPAHVYFFPAQAAGDLVAWEYISNQWVLAANGVTGKTSFTVDTDTAKLDETLIKLGLIVLYKAQKGLRFDADLVKYQDAREERFASNGGGPKTLRMAGYDPSRWSHLPDGNWPSR